MLGARFHFILIFFFLITVLYSQSDHHVKDLNKAAIENRELMRKDPEKAFSEIDKLLEESKQSKNSESELILLTNRFQYYYGHKMDFEQMKVAAEKLIKKAKDHNNIRYQAIGHQALFMTYTFNELHDHAFDELNKSIHVLKTGDANDQLIIKEKGRTYINFANHYNVKKNPHKAAEYLNLAIQEHDKLTNPELKTEYKSISYANLAAIYLDIESIDSSEYYALKSIELSKPENLEDNTIFLNYIVLGTVYQRRKDYVNALAYYQKAEKISSQKHFINVKELYKKMIEVYDATGDTESKKEYEYKVKDLELTLSKSQNKSLHQIIKDDSLYKRNSAYFITAAVILVILLLIILIYIFRKNKILANQEKISQEYLQQQSVVETKQSPGEEQSHKELLDMVKNGDPAFLGTFHKTYPEFQEKLQAINYNIVQTELEFCALLKLNLPTKDIARYKNIEHKTVQNKKYRIRKKLNIPENMDIYFWFGQL